jgi:ketosteroid isomerase-like protein
MRSGPLLFGSGLRHAARALERDLEMSSAADVVDAHIGAYRAGDVEEFMSHYADYGCVVRFDGTAMFPESRPYASRMASSLLTAPN